MGPDKSPRGARKPPATAWKPGQSGNPAGKPRGTKHKITQLAEAMIDGQAQEIVQTAIKMALGGDGPLLRALLDRLAPAPKDRHIRVKLPGVKSASDLPGITAALLAGVAAGSLTPSEAQAVAGLVEAHRKALEIADIEHRLTALEAKQEESGK